MVNADNKKGVSFNNNNNDDNKNNQNDNFKKIAEQAAGASSLLNSAKPSSSSWIKNANKETINGSPSSSNNMYDSNFAHSPSYNRRTTLENSLGSRGILCGIKNIGATCYAASLLQTMFVTPELRSHVICYPFAEKQRHKDNIAYQLQLLFAQMQGRRKAFVDPTNLLLSFNMGPGAHTQQHDVQELNRQLVDVIQGFIDRTPSSSSSRQQVATQEDAAAASASSSSQQPQTQPASPSFSSSSPTIGFQKNEVIKDLYRFYIGDVKKCLGCKTVTHSGGQVFLDISLPIANKETLERALEDYVKPDLIEGAKCENCEGPHDLEKGAVFESFPKVFSIHLLRFDFNMQTFRREKVESDLNLPINLDVNRLLFKNNNNNEQEQQDSASSPSEGIDYQYEINSVICHRGTPFHGHYYCFVRVAESEEELEEILYGKEQAQKLRENRASKPKELQEQEQETKRLINGSSPSSWVKFDDDKVTIADADEVLSYVLPTVWKERREKLKAEKEAKDEEERKKKEEETKKKQTEEESKTSEDAAPENKTSKEEEKTNNESNVIDHPLAVDSASTAAAAATSTENDNNNKTSESLSKQSDEEAIADIFSDAFGGMVESNAGPSKTNYDHLTKVSGHSYYVLYRRKDIPVTPIVKVADVFSIPKQEDIPSYVREIVNKEENELAEKAKELEELKDIVSVAIWDANTKKRTWIDVTEETTIEQLTKIAYDKIYPNQKSDKELYQQEENQEKSQVDQPVSQDASPPITNNNQEQNPVMPVFDPQLVRLRKYSIAHAVGGATFAHPEKETLASMGFKKSSSQHGQFLLETRKSTSEVEWTDVVTEYDLSLRVAKLTRNTPMNVPITEYSKIVVPANANLLQLYQKAAEMYKIPGGVGNVQLTLRKDGEAHPLSTWEPPTSSLVNMGSKQTSEDASFVMGLFSENNNSNNNNNNNEQEMTEINSTNKNNDSQFEKDAQLARELSSNSNSNKSEQQQVPRKPYYRNLETTTVKHIDLCQDDVIFVEEFQQLDLPSEAGDLRSKLIAVEFTDYQYLIKVFWTVSGFDDSLIPSSIDKKAPIFVDKRKTLLELKDKVCSTLCLFGSSSSSSPSSNDDSSEQQQQQDHLSDCQLLLDGGVREPKNLASTTIRSATFGMGTVNVEIRKGRPLQESECFVTVFKTTEDYLKNPVEEVKRILIKSDTTLFALAQAAFDKDFPNEGACGIETARGETQEEKQQEKSISQSSGGSTRVTSVCINGQHYRPRLMPSGTTVKSWGSVMYKREVKVNLTNPHVSENSEIRVVFQPIEQEEALTKNSLLLRFHRWNAMAPDVSSSLSLPGRNIVLAKDGAIESILDVFSKLSPEIPNDNIEFGRCRAYQMRSQENICNDLMWLSKSFIDMEAGKRRTLCGHPMKLENDEIILYRDSDESWPQGVNVQFGFSSVQSNSQQKDILSKSGNKKGAGENDDGKNSKKKQSTEKGISLRVVWDEDENHTAKNNQKTDSNEDDANNNTDNKNNNNDDDNDDNDSTKANADEEANNSRQESAGADAFFMDPDEELARRLQQEEDEKNGKVVTTNNDNNPADAASTNVNNTDSSSNNNNKQGSVASSVGVSDSELINFVPHEPYGELMKISLPTQCCVCFSDFEDGEAVCVTKCHHIVHRECLAPWLAQEFTCPQCKTSLW